MKRTLLITVVVVLMFGLMFAWADEKKATTTPENTPSTSATNGKFTQNLRADRATIEAKMAADVQAKLDLEQARLDAEQAILEAQQAERDRAAQIELEIEQTAVDEDTQKRIQAERMKLAIEAEGMKNRNELPVIMDTEEYCPSSYSNMTDDWITNVTFNGIDNTTGQEGAGSYGDYTAISTDACQPSQTYTLSVTFSSMTYTEHVRAWIDWNQDETFATTESYYLGSGVNATLTAEITVPVDATLGTTVLRVIEQYSTDPGADGACDGTGNHSTYYGETEDYSVLVGDYVPTYGACCDDITSICTDSTEQLDCLPPLRFSANTLCADLDPVCGEVEGACCFEDGSCAVLSPADCAIAEGDYQGDWVSCDPNPCPQPVWDCTDWPPPDKSPGGDIDTPSEPLNNQFATAAVAQVEYAYCGYIAVADTDYYAVTLPAIEDYYCLHVRVFADDTPGQYAYGDSLDPKLYIYDSDGTTELFYQDDNNGTFPDAEHYDSQYDCEDAGNCYSAGKLLYIKIVGLSATTSNGMYLLIINSYSCTPPSGRCCDFTDPGAPLCEENVYEPDCDGEFDEWTLGLDCTVSPCDPKPMGRCCDYTIPLAPVCTDTYELFCQGPEMVWVADSTCFDNPCPVPEVGDNCLIPITVTMPADCAYTDLDQYTCGRTDDYDATCLYSYDDGEDIIYELTVTEDLWANITLDPHTTTYTGILVTDVCPPDFNCIISSTNSVASPHGFTELFLEAGTYYIMVDTYDYYISCITDFDLTIDCTTTPPQGACCYGNPLFPSCVETGEEDCLTTYSGWSWTYGALCSDDPTPCPAMEVGDLCDAPIVIPSLPFNDIAQYTCGRDNTQDETCLDLYDGGEDIFYEFTLTEETLVEVRLDPKTTTYTGVSIADACPAGDTCIEFSTLSGAGIHGFTVTLAAGTYYVQVDTWPSPDCIPEFDLYIGPPALGRCCYGSPADPDCLDNMPYDECIDTYAGAWTQDLNCIDDPCPSCVVECPPAGIPEGEPACSTDYDDTYNGGCNSTVPVFQAINDGDIICGTSGTFVSTAGDSRDTDWFEYVLTERKRVNWTCTAEFPVLLFIIDGTAGCDGITLADGTADYCTTLTITAVVDPGTYWFWVGPQVYGDTPYNCPLNYVAEMTVEDPPPPPPNDLCDSAITVTIPSTTLGYTTGGTIDDAPTCITTVTAPGVWYSVIGNGNTLIASTCNAYTTYDTKLCVYTGGCDNLTCVTGNDDNCTEFSLRSEVTWCSEIGLEYLILVQGFSDAVGDFQLDIIDGDPCEPPTGRCCYGNPYDPTCVDSVTNSECTNTYSGVWTEGLNCIDDPCDTYGGIDVTPGSVLDSVDAVGSGNTKTETLTVSNVGANTLNFTVSVSMDAPAPANAAELIEDGTPILNSSIQANEKQDNSSSVPPDPNVILQGGDNIASATVIGAIPYSDTGTTVGYTHDYDEECPYTLGTAPDVVYSYAPGADEFIDISLCNSLYDTKLYVYEDSVGNLAGCSDDACGDDGYKSELLNLSVLTGHTYFIIVDGYATNSGQYYLDVTPGVIPPTGRCCDYTDPLDPICTDSVYQVDCIGTWIEGLNCTDNPCDELPHCDAEALVGFNPMYPEDAGWNFGTSDTYYNYIRYDNFAGVFGTIEGMKFWGADADFALGECDEDPNGLIITFYADDGLGNPGAVVYTETVDLSGTSTGLTYVSGIGDLYSKEWTVTFASSFTLSEGWVSIEGLSDPPNACVWLWNSTLDGDGFSWFFDGATMVADDNDWAFCLTGTYEAPWLTVDTYGDSILQGDPAVDVIVTMDAENLECDNLYTGSINFASNDPVTPVVNVPVTFEVCYVPGACCVGGECVVTTNAAGCEALTGTWFEGETCPEFEDCPLSCFEYLPGDVNMANGAWPPMVIGGDVTFLVNYFRGMTSSFPCSLGGYWASADANGDCLVIGSDVTYLVNYFRGMGLPKWCGDGPPDPNEFVPCWPTPDDLPDDPPTGWPNCISPPPPGN
ncbi:MAG: hypothetical protein GY839_21460 [candidate division Zixibacteria bacterium]|nr:hypothetical protein [candidate division Zixibacteria bacterium]